LSHRNQLLKTLELPPIPAAGQELLVVINNPDVEISDLAGAIEKDPGLTARLIGLANSAFFGSRNPIVRVEDAIIKVLGVRMVKSIAMSLVLSGSLKTNKCENFSAIEFWKTTLACSQLSRQLCLLSQNKAVAADDAYLCGLLHGFGQLLLIHLFPEDMNDLLGVEANQLSRATLLNAESEAFDMNECQAGSWVCMRWQLPEFVSTVIRHLDDPEYDGEHKLLIGIIRYALATTEAIRNEEELPTLDPILLDKLAIDSSRLDKKLDEFIELYNSIETLAKLISRINE
jgi:HD-like signal output (HDOD) protein